MTVKTKLTQKDYINASLATIWARPFTRIFISIFCLIILINLIVSSVNGGPGAVLPGLLPPVIILILYSGMVYFGFKRSYSNNKRAGENIEYTFDQNNLIIKGESFRSELAWNAVYKVTQTKNWLLIWQNRQIANAIPRRDIVLESELDDLKNILTSNHVKNNL